MDENGILYDSAKILQALNQSSHFIIKGLFHKDNVKESRYDLASGIQEATNHMTGQVVQEDEKAKFNRIMKQMRENVHFKEFFLHHEDSLKTGMARLDEAAQPK